MFIIQAPKRTLHSGVHQILRRIHIKGTIGELACIYGESEVAAQGNREDYREDQCDDQNGAAVGVGSEGVE